MDQQELMALWDRFDCSDASELEYKKGDLTFVLKRNSLKEQDGHENGSLSQAKAAQGSAQGGKAFEKNAKTKSIKAPLVGTFYRAASPEAEAYVMIGQEVKKGDVIGIIESMKMMNEVLADCDGKVLSIDAEDGSFVEFEQSLITLEAGNV